MFRSLKENWALYLFHILFVSIISTGFTFVLSGVFEFIINPNKSTLQDFSTSVIFAPIIGIIFGVFITIPLGLISLYVFKKMMDSGKRKPTPFSLIGAVFGIPIIVIHYLASSNSADFSYLVSLLLLVIGAVTGYILFSFWNSYYFRLKDQIKT